MKQWMTVLLAALLAATLCACGAGDASTPAETEAPAAATAEPIMIENTAPESNEPDAVLTALLGMIAKEYQPGTAGCSLTATRLAGQLLDWNAVSKLGKTQLSATAATFLDGLDEAGKASFLNEQIGPVYDAAMSLTGDDAADQLDSAGYKGMTMPWTAQTVKTLFGGIYSGLGLTLPA